MPASTVRYDGSHGTHRAGSDDPGSSVSCDAAREPKAGHLLSRRRLRPLQGRDVPEWCTQMRRRGLGVLSDAKPCPSRRGASNARCASTRDHGEAHRRYTVEVNRREGWTGYLWQGRFASFPMDERYTLAAARYRRAQPGPGRPRVARRRIPLEQRAGASARSGRQPWCPSSRCSRMPGLVDIRRQRRAAGARR